MLTGRARSLEFGVQPVLQMARKFGSVQVGVAVIAAHLVAKPDCVSQPESLLYMAFAAYIAHLSGQRLVAWSVRIRNAASRSLANRKMCRNGIPA
jgi:hypothetical protein